MHADPVGGPGVVSLDRDPQIAVAQQAIPHDDRAAVVGADDPHAGEVGHGRDGVGRTRLHERSGMVDDHDRLGRVPAFELDDHRRRLGRRLSKEGRLDDLKLDVGRIHVLGEFEDEVAADPHRVAALARRMLDDDPRHLARDGDRHLAIAEGRGPPQAIAMRARRIPEEAFDGSVPDGRVGDAFRDRLQQPGRIDDRNERLPARVVLELHHAERVLRRPRVPSRGWRG